MGEAILLYGRSGSGKSRSLVNFGEDEIFLVQTIKKRLPFRKQFKYSMVTDKVDTIMAGLQKMPTKVAVIDDAGYLMTNEFMKRHSGGKKGSSSFDLYNDIADSFWNLLNSVKALPDDVIVYIIMHEDTNDYGETKLRTIGKLLNDKVCIEGMCTVVLRCVIEGDQHYFLTQGTGTDVSKSPEGMFDELKIENDLKSVDERIRDYWNLGGDK
jgi:hypothetical protein